MAAVTCSIWEMTEVELARVLAEHFGFTVRGNWIRSPRGRSVAWGWEMFAEKLVAKGWIKRGVGVNWRKAGERPTLPRVTRNSKGYWA